MPEHAIPPRGVTVAPSKPQKVNELIWAYNHGDSGRIAWRRATITSRGGADPHRITVECDGRKWQCDESPLFGITTRSDARHAPRFCRDSERPNIEQQRHFFRRIQAQALGFNDEGASPEALSMLGLRRPFTRVDVQHAFRVKSLKAHPDQGGDADLMIALRQARDAAMADADG